MSFKKRILVTGGSGFIGTNAVEYFKQKNFEVLNIDIKQSQIKDHLSLWSKCDILDPEQLKRLIKDFDPHYLLHLAAKTDLEGKDIQAYAANTCGVENTIEAARACKSLQRIIFASSRMVCQIGYQPKDGQDYCPTNFYGESKVRTEQIVRNSEINCEWMLVRPTSIWGPWFDVPYKIFFTTIAKRLYFNPSGYDPMKSFGFVGNTLYQLDKLLSAPVELVNHKTMYLCDYPALNLRHWTDLIRKSMNLSPIPTIPYPFLRMTAGIGDALMWLGYNFPLTTFRLNNLVTDMVYDTSPLRDICGPLPYTIEEGVRQTVEWMCIGRNSP